MQCNPRTWVERLDKKDRLTENDKLAIEVALRNECPIMAQLKKGYNSYLINEYRERKERDDPTTQEEDRQSWWSKVRKK